MRIDKAGVFNPYTPLQIRAGDATALKQAADNQSPNTASKPALSAAATPYLAKLGGLQIGRPLRGSPASTTARPAARPNPATEKPVEKPQTRPILKPIPKPFVVSNIGPTITGAEVANLSVTGTGTATPAPVLTASNTLSGADSPAAPSPTTNGGTGEPLTLNGLLKSWGPVSGGDSPYDLNHDGTVNIDDLFEFIHSIAPPASPIGPEKPLSTPAPAIVANGEVSTGDSAPPTGATGPEKPLPIPAIAIGPDSQIVTGNTAPPVGGPGPEKPLPIAAAGSGSQLGTDASPPPTGGTPPLDAATAQRHQLTLDGLLKAWGQGNSEYDLDGNGTVNIDDLFAFIHSLPAHAPPHSPTSAEALGEKRSQVNLAANSTDSIGRADKLQKFTASLLNRLDDLGFSDQPPANIRELVSQLDLSSKQQSHVFDQLQAKYPNGLGVNVVG